MTLMAMVLTDDAMFLAADRSCLFGDYFAVPDPQQVFLDTNKFLPTASKSLMW